MDEVLFLMAEAQVKLDKKAAAVGYLETMLKKYPESRFAKRAQEQLEKLKSEVKG
jgi:TolA-binding protein